jgi:hypothetical protein
LVKVAYQYRLPTHAVLNSLQPLILPWWPGMFVRWQQH